MASDEETSRGKPSLPEGTPLRILTALGVMFYVSVGAALGFVLGEFLAASPLIGLILGAVIGFLFERLGAGPLELYLQQSESWPRLTQPTNDETGFSIGRWLDSWKYFSPPSGRGESGEEREE